MGFSAHFFNFAGVDIQLVVALVTALGGVVITRLAIGPGHIFTHERADVLACGLAIGASAGQPAVVGNGTDKGRIAEQMDVAVVANFDMGLSIGHVSKFFDCHFWEPLSFIVI